MEVINPTQAAYDFYILCIDEAVVARHLLSFHVIRETSSRFIPVLGKLGLIDVGPCFLNKLNNIVF